MSKKMTYSEMREKERLEREKMHKMGKNLDKAILILIGAFIGMLLMMLRNSF